MTIREKPVDPFGRLGARERELMTALFALGNRASAEDVRGQLSDAPTLSTVRVMLGRLEKKGFVSHTQEGARYLYSATTTAAAAGRAHRQLHLKTFFGGSRLDMVLSFVREGSWTAPELAELRRAIDRARKGKS